MDGKISEIMKARWQAMGEALATVIAWPPEPYDFGSLAGKRWAEQAQESMAAEQAAGLALAVAEACRWGRQSHIKAPEYQANWDRVERLHNSCVAMKEFIQQDETDLRGRLAKWTSVPADDVKADMDCRCPWLTSSLPEPEDLHFQVVDKITGEPMAGYYDDEEKAAAMAVRNMTVEPVPFYSLAQLEENLSGHLQMSPVVESGPSV
jgi:hypothetical protein